MSVRQRPMYAYVYVSSIMYAYTYPEPVGDGLRIIRAVAGIPGAAAEEELGRGGGAGEEGLGGEADGEGELEVVPLPGAADPRVPPAGFFGGGQPGGARRRGGGGGGVGGGVAGGGEAAAGAPLGGRRGRGRVDGGGLEQRVVREERQPRVVRGEVERGGGGGRRWRKRRVKGSAAVRHGRRRADAWRWRGGWLLAAESGDWRWRWWGGRWCGAGGVGLCVKGS